MSEWTEVLFTYDEVEAEIVKDLLEAENIQVVLKSLKITPYPVSIGRIGEIRLLVRNEDFEKAKDVLKIMQDSSENGVK
ncbi:MAG TPA: DUF2007 domain-containing protein [Nitrospirae bacterium]|nr:hypothetical protein BMS3Abin06_00765 [bacterium BMS3Abin06]HDH10735.1 DUF2007 domain-containing protein [Nitrospirota bacterium]HDZ03023.1 DUF2007 domain-containing protein [Nitrospirota bacterium]